MSKYGDYRICFSNDLSDPKNQVTIIGDKEPLSQFQEKMDEWRGAKKKADEYEVKAKSFDYARGKLITKIQNLRDRADRADDIEVENELRERLSKFEEVDNNLMAAFVKASFGQEAKEKESSENKGRESLRAKLREKTANALDKKLEHEIKKGSKRLWD